MFLFSFFVIWRPLGIHVTPTWLGELVPQLIDRNGVWYIYTRYSYNTQRMRQLRFILCYKNVDRVKGTTTDRVYPYNVRVRRHASRGKKGGYHNLYTCVNTYNKIEDIHRPDPTPTRVDPRLAERGARSIASLPRVKTTTFNTDTRRALPLLTHSSLIESRSLAHWLTRSPRGRRDASGLSALACSLASSALSQVRPE